MADLAWYWHRLRAMSPLEMALHARKKLRQRTDAKRVPDGAGLDLRPTGAFPVLPAPEAAPGSLKQALAQDADAILAGRWRAFGHLELQVDDPPKWHCDYLAGQDIPAEAPAFRLNHRSLPNGCDVKLVWELSRWYALVRLAQAAHVLGDERAARKCLAWLEDWARHNPPYRGWNWTSALEGGMRLIQFTWIDGLLRAAAARRGWSDLPDVLDRLGQTVLPAHVSFTWRHQSFGSSANNHLLGELVGVLLAVARWPQLARLSASLDKLQSLWEREVLAQFAEDGGNREQALNYQLFSLEFALQARAALGASGRTISPEVEQRLTLAAGYFREVQARRDHWDYGDSDSAYVVPVFADDRDAAVEWHGWVEGASSGAAVHYWMGEPLRFEPPIRHGQPQGTADAHGWCFFPQSGHAVCESGEFWLRWDLSPLGYLATAAHGHLDALHLSIWRRGVALVIDPGTGCYYYDKTLRNWLASRSAHNGPCPEGDEWPKRMGPFLWQQHHRQPGFEQDAEGVIGSLALARERLRRRIVALPDGAGWQVEDGCVDLVGAGLPFSVRWQFAPRATVQRLAERRFRMNREGETLEIQVGGDWSEVELVEAPVAEILAGTVSQRFRQTQWAPYLRLKARPAGSKPCQWTTTFLASGAS